MDTIKDFGERYEFFDILKNILCVKKVCLIERVFS